MKRIHILLFHLIAISNINGQDIVPISDAFMQKHKFISDDIIDMKVYVKFVKDRFAKEPVSNVKVTISGKEINDGAEGRILTSNYRPVSDCRIVADFGNDIQITFVHRAGDNEFFTYNNGICLMLYTDDSPGRISAGQSQTSIKRVFNNLQSIIDNSPDYSTINIPLASYVSVKQININNRHSLRIIFEPGTEVYCSSSYNDVLNMSGSSDISIVNGKFTHIKITEDQCAGSVFYLYNCNNITLEKCDINGCGIIGVQGYDLEDVTIKNCFLHDNRYSAYKFGNKISGIKLMYNRVENNPKFDRDDAASMKSMDIKEINY